MAGFGSLWFSSSPFRKAKQSKDASSPAMYKRSANKGQQKQQQQQQPTHAAKPPKHQLQTLVFKVQIHCEACMKKVKKAIGSTDGVESISVDLKQKRITVSGHFDQQKLLKRVAKTGKQVELVTGKDGTGNSSSNNNKNIAMDDKPFVVLPVDLTAAKTSTQITPADAGTSFMFSDENVNGCSIM